MPLSFSKSPQGPFSNQSRRVLAQKSYTPIITRLSMGKRPFSRKNCNIFCNLVAFSRFGRQIRGTGGPGGQRFGKGQAPAEGRTPPDGKVPQRTVNDRQAVSPRRMQATLRRLLTARQPCEEKTRSGLCGPLRVCARNSRHSRIAFFAPECYLSLIHI